MHESVKEFGWRIVEANNLGQAEKILDVGSYNMNGSLRDYFAQGQYERTGYVGIDVIEGRGVDLIASASDIPFANSWFDVVVCCEMLEHDPTPWLTLPEIGRVLRSGGHLILTARGGDYPVHMCPNDYYRYTKQGFEILLELAGLTPVEIQDDPQYPGVMAHAIKA